MKIFLAQTKPTLGNVDKNLKEMISIIKKEIENKTKLIIFPELSLTGYLLEELTFNVAIENVPTELIELSKKISIIFGAVELGTDLFCYNSAFYLEDGIVKHIHRKIYLPTYGLFDEGRYFKEGNNIKAFDTKFGRIGMLICEDAFHQSPPYILTQDGANIIFIISSSPTRLSSGTLEINSSWEAICKSISITNSCFTVMSNRVGVEDGVNYWGGSFAVNPTGKIIEKLDFFCEDGKIIEIDKKEIIKTRFSSSSIKNEKLDLVINELKRIKSNK